MGCKKIEKKNESNENKEFSYFIFITVLHFTIQKMITAPGKLYVANVGIIC